MTFLSFFFIFCLGAIVGSFLNVVILRYNTGRTIAGRSGCAQCGAQLRWFELLPIGSFLIQKGKCRTCGSSISWQYPLVELLTAILFVLNYYRFGIENLTTFVFSLVIWALLVVILVYDMRHKIIPDAFVYAFIAFSFIALFLPAHTGESFASPSLNILLAGPLIALPFAFLWLVSGGRWMGFGDAKLALGIGWVLGITGGLSALFFAFWIGAVVSIVLVCVDYAQYAHACALSEVHGRFTMKSEVPFAPFLILGFAIVFFFNINLVAYLMG
ncbi:MAG: prepilin peptidase [Candidatus Campbellbacteria bacterium]|nr:prepilin peptidase [Candidatus Campbellbacteria bacterium]